jgi:hypothetical protein
MTPLNTDASYFSEGKRTIELCKKEGLEMVMQNFAMDMMIAYSLVADTLNCWKYTRLALGIAKAGAPFSHRDIAMVERYVEDPRTAAGGEWGKRSLRSSGSA